MPVLEVGGTSDRTVINTSPVLVLNETRKTLLASRLRVQPAVEPRRFRAGGPILPGDGLWVEHGNQIDSTGMPTALDLLFLDADHRVVELITAMAPGSLSPVVPHATGVLELPPGTIPSTRTQIGDHILIEAIDVAGKRALG